MAFGARGAVRAGGEEPPARAAARAARPDAPPDHGLLRAVQGSRSSIVLVAILLTSLLGLVNPLLLGRLIDDVDPRHRDFDKLNLYVGLMIVIPIVSGLIGVGQTYLNNVIGQSVMQDLRGALYAHLQRMPLRFFTETRTGEIQSRLANDVGGDPVGRDRHRGEPDQQRRDRRSARSWRWSSSTGG